MGGVGGLEVRVMAGCWGCQKNDVEWIEDKTLIFILCGLSNSYHRIKR